MAEPQGLYAKVAAIQGEITKIAKTGTVEFGKTKYDYMTEAELIGAIKPKLAARGVAMLCGVTDYTRTGNSAIIVLRVTLVDGETKETHSELFPNEGVDSGDKAFNKAYTGAMKYALQKLFLVATDGVADPDQGNDRKIETAQNGKSEIKKLASDQQVTEIKQGVKLLGMTWAQLRQRLQALGMTNIPDDAERALVLLTDVQATRLLEELLALADKAAI